MPLARLYRAPCVAQLKERERSACTPQRTSQPFTVHRCHAIGSPSLHPLMIDPSMQRCIRPLVDGMHGPRINEQQQPADELHSSTPPPPPLLLRVASRRFAWSFSPFFRFVGSFVHSFIRIVRSHRSFSSFVGIVGIVRSFVRSFVVRTFVRSFVVVASLHRCIVASLHRCIVASLHHCIVASLAGTSASIHTASFYSSMRRTPSATGP